MPRDCVGVVEELEEGGSVSRMYAVIAVALDDPPERRRRDICEGIGFAFALLMDEYGMTAGQIQQMCDDAADEAFDYERVRENFAAEDTQP